MYNAFISHASQDSAIVSEVVRSLSANGVNLWFDDNAIQAGPLLRNQLHDAIRNSGTTVLFWSQDAFQSRWVMAEMFTSFHVDHSIIACVLDDTPLPVFLKNSTYLSLKRDQAQLADKVRHAIETAPKHANEVIELPTSQVPEIMQLSDAIAQGQYAVLATLEKDYAAAAKANEHVNSAMETLKQLAPVDRLVLSLAGYQCKNNYIVKYWDSIRQWSFPEDELLMRGERYFFETLCANPKDANAVNGLGSILTYELELDAAEFFQRCAIELMRLKGQDYEAASHDLEMILELKRQQTGYAGVN